MAIYTDRRKAMKKFRPPGITTRAQWSYFRVAANETKREVEQEPMEKVEAVAKPKPLAKKPKAKPKKAPKPKGEGKEE